MAKKLYKCTICKKEYIKYNSLQKVCSVPCSIEYAKKKEDKDWKKRKRKMKEALKINGTLIVLDLFQGEGLRDALTNVLAILAHLVLSSIKNGRLREAHELRKAWDEHGQSDSYLTLSHIRQVCASILPGARVRKHLLWRYSITWKKPGASG